MPSALFITKTALAHLNTLPVDARDHVRAGCRYLYAHPDELENNRVQDKPNQRWWMFEASGRVHRIVFDVRSREPNWIILSVEVVG